jgi:hypothetical protein
MADNKELDIKLKLKDEASEALKKTGSEAKKMGTDIKDAGKQASDGVNAAGQNTKKAASGMVAAWGDVKRAVTDFAKSQAGQLLGGLSIYAIVTKAITLLYNAIKQGITDAVNKAADMQKMQVLVEAAGDSWAEMKPKIDKTFESIKAVTGFTGGEMRSAFSKMTLLIGDANVANKQMMLAADMAASGLFDLESASQAISMAFEGNIGRLGRLLPELRNMDAVLGENASRAEKADYILGKLQDRFGGLATDLESDRESLDKFARSWKELKTNAMQPALPIIGDLADAMDGLNEAMGDDKRGKMEQFWESFKRGWKDLTPGSKIITSLIAATGVGLPGAAIGLSSRGGRKEYEDKMFSRINTRNEEYVKLYNKAMSGDSLTGGEVKRLKHLQILYDETNAVTDALKKHIITEKEAYKAYEQLSQAQYLRGKIVDKLKLGYVEDEATKEYNQRRALVDIKEAKNLRDKQLKDLKDTGKQLQLTDKEIAEKRLEIYQKYYDSIKSAAGIESGVTEAAAKELIKYRKIAESYSVKEKKPLTEDQKIANYLKAEEVKTQDEINNALAEGNDALEIQKKHLLEQIEHLKNNKAAYEELVRLKTDVIKIDREIAKNNEEAAKKQEEMWKKSDEEDRKRGEEALRAKAEKIKSIQEEGELKAETRIINAHATGINALRIKLQEHKNILELLKQEGANEQLIQEWTNKIKQDEWDIANAKKDQLDKQKELFAKVVGGATQGVLDATVGNEAEVKKRLSDIEDDYTATIADIQNQVRLAQMTGEEYDPLGAIADAKKRRIESKRANKLPVTIAEEQDYAATAMQSKIAERQKQQAQELKSSVSDAFYQGMTEGTQKGLAGFLDMLKNKIKRQLADSMADAILGTGKKGAGGGFDIMSIFGMGGGTGKQVPMATATGAGAFATGWAGMASQAAAMSGGGAATSGGGGLFSMLGLGGVAGGLGAIMPWLGLASIASGFFGKKQKQNLSGVQQITQPTIRTTDNSSLFGSDIFESASFSARNRGNALLKERAAARSGQQEVKVTVNPSKIFDVTVEQKAVRRMSMNDIKGVQNRTGYTYG